MSNTLGEEEDVLQGLGFGTHQVSLSASAVSQINTRTSIFDLPYLFEDRAAVQTFIDSPAGAMLAEGFEGTGMVLAAMWDNGFRQITNTVRPIVTPSDLDGLKIRTPTNRQRVEMFNTLGANATPWSFAWGEKTDTETIAALADKIAVNEIDFAALQSAAAPLYESPTFVDVIGADMISATKSALGIE